MRGTPRGIPRTDAAVGELAGTELASEIHAGVTFRLERMLGEGGSAISFFALRFEGSLRSPVVVKVIRPSVLDRAPREAALFIRKEAVALGRLNERVPPTPFVVRVFDVGAIGDGSRELPWIAVEYVHGGHEGTTLGERVEYAIASSGVAWSPDRAARALQHLGSGLTAMGEVGLIHRDLTPRNVLCCGYADAELLKISDFGLSRIEGMHATFAGSALGTPGYAAPEQVFAEGSPVGPAADTFSLGCIAYFMLTGRHYFPATNHAQLVALLETNSRPTLAAARVAPALRARPDIERRLDAAIARATHADVAQRPCAASDFAVEAAELLEQCGEGHSTSAFITVVPSRPLPVQDWLVRSEPSDRLVRSVAWEGNGHALVATQGGMHFWDGLRWFVPSARLLPGGRAVDHVHRIGAGRYVLCDAGKSLWLYGLGGLEQTIAAPEPEATLTSIAGDPRRLAVAAGSVAKAPCVWPVAAGQFFSPVFLPGVSSLAINVRLDEKVWIVGGRTARDEGFVARFVPTHGTLEPVRLPSVPPLVAGSIRRGTALLVGRKGIVVTLGNDGPSVESLPNAPDLASCALDIDENAWIGGSGVIWSRCAAESTFRQAFADGTISAPFVALDAEGGRVVAMTANGAVIEGRPIPTPPS